MTPVVTWTPQRKSVRFVGKDSAEQVTVYTDGSASTHTRAGGWSFIALWRGQERVRLGAELPTTVNKMELRAITEVFRYLPLSDVRVELFTDSEYVLRSIAQLPRVSSEAIFETRGGLTIEGEEIKNLAELLALWEVLKHHVESRDVEFVWLKGHTGHEFNEAVDQGASLSRVLLEQISPFRNQAGRKRLTLRKK